MWNIGNKRAGWGGRFPWGGYVWNKTVFPYVYGIRWDSGNTGDTIQPGIVNADGSFVSKDYSDMPIQEQLGRYLLTNSGTETKLKSDDSTKLASDGSAATLDGSSGQVVVRIPKFHQLIMRDGDDVYFLISEGSFSFKSTSSWISPAFYKGQSSPNNFRYPSAFQAVAASDSTSATAKSIVKDTSGYAMSNPNPFTNRERGQFRSQCNDGIFHQWDYGLWEVIALLFLTEFKDWNSQNVLPGYTEAGSWDYSYTRNTGRTTSLGDASGSIQVNLDGDDSDLDGIVSSGDYVANSYRGIENIFGNVQQWVDGINIDNRTDTTNGPHIYTCYDPANFADDTTTDYQDTGHAPGFGDTNDYIKDILGQDKLCPFYPSELGGSSSTYITDYNWNAAGAWRVLGVGGDLSHGALAGLACLVAQYASSDWHSRIGARTAA